MPKPEPVSIRQLEIEAFRAFRDRQVFDLSASAIVVTGTNGTGKTSFFDAIQWLLTGSIPRLAALRTRLDDEHIVNSYRVQSSALVEAELAIEQDIVRVTRIGNYRGSELRWADSRGPKSGPDAEEALRRALTRSASVSLQASLLNTALLEQDVVRGVLLAKPAERYDLLSRMLGLDRVEAFEASAESRAGRLSQQTKVAESALLEARRREEAQVSAVSELRQRSAGHPSLEAAREHVVSAASLSGLVEIREGEFSEPTVVARFTSQATVLARELRALNAQRSEVQGADVQSLAAAVGRLTTAMETGTRRVAELQTAHHESLALEERAQASANDFQRLVALVLPLLTDICPICQQSIDRAHVEAELKRVAPDTEGLTELKQQQQRIAGDLANAERELVDLSRQLETARAAQQRHQELEAQVRSRLARLSSSLDAGPLRMIGDKAKLLDDVKVAQTLADQFEDVANAATVLVATLTAAAQAQDLPRHETELKLASQETATAALKHEEAEERERRAKELLRASRKAGVDVMKSRFDQVEPLISQIYQRLNPHPTFKSFSLAFDVYRARGSTVPQVHDADADVDANPMLIFSSAQANIAALAYFLAIGWASREAALPFVLLDDPLQSMDDVNALGFADLCRFIREDRQLVVSTHEKRLASLLERKLAPRSEVETTLVLEFTGWDRSGPTVVRRTLPYEAREAEVLLVANA